MARSAVQRLLNPDSWKRTKTANSGLSGSRPSTKMIGILWNSLFGVGGNKVKQTPINEDALSNLDSAQEEHFYQLPLEEEVEVLARELGGLASGMTLEIDLHRILEICPRKRKKADAYLGLKKKLRDEYGVELVITSRASKKEEPGDGEE